MRRRLAAPAALAVLTLGLAACAGDDGTGPVTEAPPTLIDNDDASDGGWGSDGGGSEASDGGGSTEAAPDIPAPDPDDYPGMDEETPEGAVQTLRYFWDGAFWGYQTGDNSIVVELSTEDCANCKELAQQIEDVGSEGLYWSEFDIELIDATYSDSLESYEHAATYSFEVSAHSEPGEDPEEVPATVHTSAGGMLWNGESWQIDDFTLQGDEVN